MLKTVSRITACEDISLITLKAENPGRDFAPSILTALANAGINVDMISQSAVQGGSIDFSFTLADNSMQEAILLIRKLENGAPRSQCVISSGNCKLSFYGDLMQTTPGVAAAVLSQVSNAGVMPKIITTSTVDISVLVDSHDYHDLCQYIEKITGLTINVVPL